MPSLDALSSANSTLVETLSKILANALLLGNRVTEAIRSLNILFEPLLVVVIARVVLRHLLQPLLQFRLRGVELVALPY